MDKIVVNSQDSVRLDRYIRRCYRNATQGIIEKFLRKGQIKLNSKKAKTSTRVQNGDIITVAAGVFSKEIVSSQNSDINFSSNVISLGERLISELLLYSSEEFIAINKPSGLAVQGGSKISLSIDDALNYLNHSKNTQYKLVHRLDKETSGVLLIANGFENAAKLGNAFKEKLITKIYIAVLCGCPKHLEGKIENNIGKDRSGIFEIVKELSIGGKLAKTMYKVLQSRNNISLVEFYPLTGRMHQLRFHAKYLGCTILGDTKYGGAKYKRLMLHARTIVIPASIFGKEIKIESKTPKGFNIDNFI